MQKIIAIISIVTIYILIPREKLHIYENFALGTKISLQIYHYSQQDSESLALRAFSEVRRLENIFSLYIDDSAISQLNREGHLENPPPELVELINLTQKYSQLSNGKYDITIQNKWLGKEGDIGYQHIIANTGKIYFTKPNMAITLNSVAQGYITDQITEMLISQGIDKALIDIGEIRAIGNGWKVKIKHSNRVISLNNAAISTSAGYGMKRDAGNHLINPIDGNSPQDNYSISIIAPNATIADIISTAIVLGANIPNSLYTEKITINVK